MTNGRTDGQTDRRVRRRAAPVTRRRQPGPRGSPEIAPQGRGCRNRARGGASAPTAADGDACPRPPRRRRTRRPRRAAGAGAGRSARRRAPAWLGRSRAVRVGLCSPSRSPLLGRPAAGRWPKPVRPTHRRPQARRGVRSQRPSGPGRPRSGHLGDPSESGQTARKLPAIMSSLSPAVPGPIALTRTDRRGRWAVLHEALLRAACSKLATGAARPRQTPTSTRTDLGIGPNSG